MHNVSTVTQAGVKSCATLSMEASRPTPALYNMLRSTSHLQSTTSQLGLTLPFIGFESPFLCGGRAQAVQRGFKTVPQPPRAPCCPGFSQWNMQFYRHLKETFSPVKIAYVTSHTSPSLFSVFHCCEQKYISQLTGDEEMGCKLAALDSRSRKEKGARGMLCKRKKEVLFSKFLPALVHYSQVNEPVPGMCFFFFKEPQSEQKVFR